MKFKIDENTALETADILGEAGHDAITLGQEGMLGSRDETVAHRVRLEDRVLLTTDLDFADIRAYPPADYAGIIVLRPSRQIYFLVMDMVKRIVPLLEVEPVAGYLWIVSHSRVRIVGGGRRHSRDLA